MIKLGLAPVATEVLGASQRYCPSHCGLFPFTQLGVLALAAGLEHRFLLLTVRHGLHPANGGIVLPVASRWRCNLADQLGASGRA